MKAIIKHIRRWKLWRKYNCNGRIYQLCVLVGLAVSPTFYATYLPEEMAEMFSWLDAERKNKMEWISVKKEIPRQSGRYLVAIKEGSCYSVMIRTYDADKLGWYDDRCLFFKPKVLGVTHWMYLPGIPVE